MKILKHFTNWSNKTGAENKKKTNNVDHYDYIKKIRATRAEANQKFKRWEKDLKMSNYIATGSLLTGGTGTVTASTFDSNYTIQPSIMIDGSKNMITINTPLEVNGRDILKELDEMRDALLLLKREVDMEAKYPKLKELKDQYEKELAKYKTFEALK
jgi:hypothetical protein